MAFTSLHGISIHGNFLKKTVTTPVSSFIKPPILSVPGSGIYAVNWVNLSYIGPIYNLRRSSDNVIQDFYTDYKSTSITTSANGEGTTIASWLGESTAYITTWYDQSTNDRHSTQTTTTLQPTFVVSDNKINFNGSQYLVLPASVISTSLPFTVSYKHDTYSTTRNTFVSLGYWVNDIGFRGTQIGESAAGVQNYLCYLWGGSGIYTTATMAPKNIVTYIATTGTNNMTIYVNKTLNVTGTFTLSKTPNSTGYIGTSLSSNNINMNESTIGDLYGVFAFASALNANSRDNIESLYYTSFTSIASFSKNDMNLQNWYNPDNAIVTSGYVSSWPDSMGNYNLNNVAVGGTGNTMTKVFASGTTSNVIYQSTVSATGNFSYLYGDTGFSETIYSVMFCCNTLIINGDFDEIFGDKVKVGSIRFTASRNVPQSLNNGDLNYGGSTYINGVSVQASASTCQYPLTVPTGYTIYCFYISNSVYAMRTLITQLCILGDYASTYRSFNGYAGDFFIGNASFGTTQQQRLEGYLGYKYKCQSSLPTNHPYYSATNSNIVTLS